MKRSARRPVAAARLGLVAAVAALGLSGCALASPTTITTPYPAADGSNAQIDDGGRGTQIRLSNFLAVGSAQDGAAVVVGGVTAQGSATVEVKLAVFASCATDSTGGAPTPLAQATVSVQPGTLAQVGPAGVWLQVPKLPTPPGTYLCLRAQAATGGTQLDLPVLAPTQQYATITPTPAAST